MAKNPLEMSDEEIMQMGAPEEISEQPDKDEKESSEGTSETTDSKESEQEHSDESVSEENSGSENEEPKEENSEVKEKTDELAENNEKSDEKTADNVQDAEKSDKINYEELYKKILAPFKANGKTITLNSPEEAIQLMQMGANYTRKMQAIAPYKKHIMMLEKNGLLDEDKLSFLIDLDKKDPEAIKKFLKDSNVDPLDIDTTVEPQYKAGNHRVTNEEAAFVSVLDDLKQSEDGYKTIQEIDSNWDEASKDMLWSNPEIMRTIHEQRSNGIYKAITTEIERQRMLGKISANKPFLQAYREIGDELSRLSSQAQKQPIASRAKTSRSTLTNNDRAKKAAPNRTSSSTSKSFINPLAMSDDEFLKAMEGRL